MKKLKAMCVFIFVTICVLTLLSAAAQGEFKVLPTEAQKVCRLILDTIIVVIRKPIKSVNDLTQGLLTILDKL